MWSLECVNLVFLLALPENALNRLQRAYGQLCGKDLVTCWHALNHKTWGDGLVGGHEYH